MVRLSMDKGTELGLTGSIIGDWKMRLEETRMLVGRDGNKW